MDTQGKVDGWMDEWGLEDELEDKKCGWEMGGK